MTAIATTSQKLQQQQHTRRLTHEKQKRMTLERYIWTVLQVFAENTTKIGRALAMHNEWDDKLTL